MDTDDGLTRHVLLTETVELYDTDAKTNLDLLSDDYSTIVIVDDNLESTELFEISKEHRMASVREQVGNNIDMIRDDMNVGEKIALVTSVKFYDVEMDPLVDESVSRKKGREQREPDRPGEIKERAPLYART